MKKRNYRRSRLAKIEKQKTVKTVFLSILMIIIVVMALAYFGIPLLIKLAVFFSEIRSPSSSEKITDQTIIPKPVIDAIPEATFSASLQVSGYSQPGYVITLLLNGQKYKQELADSDGVFRIKINLAKGENIITAYATDSQNNQGPLSTEFSVNYDDQPPILEITSPADKSDFYGASNKIIEINGKTEPDVSLTINNRFIVLSSDGLFSQRFELSEGENQFTALASDPAGNETAVDFTLLWQP